MADLLRIIPPGGLVVDPFAGSGTTGVAALAHGCDFIGIEREAVYAQMATQRLGRSQVTAPECRASS